MLPLICISFLVAAIVLTKMNYIKIFSSKHGQMIHNSSPTQDLFGYKHNLPVNTYIPIVYNNNYDISFFGLQRLHKFDCQKWGKTHRLLQNFIKGNYSTISPLRAITNDELSKHHTPDFMNEIQKPATIANTAEIFLLRFLQTSTLQSTLLKPFKWQTSGSILAANQALIHGKAIHLGGGFHHAYATKSGGFCFFADISLIIKYLWEKVNKEMKFLIVDLDAHQGNGHEQDKFLMLPKEKDRIFIIDMYNADIYPDDKVAKPEINVKVEMSSRTNTDQYLNLLNESLTENTQTIIDFKPNLLIYNAGTDILSGDNLGRLDVSPDGVVDRDEMVFRFAAQHKIPIVFLMSGGYQMTNAKVVSRSIINLIEKGLVKPIHPVVAKSQL